MRLMAGQSRSQPGTRSELLMAISYEHLKQLDQANHYLELAKGRAPDNPDVQRSLAGYYRETGNYAKRLRLKSIRNPKPDVKAELAYTYQLDGNRQDGRSYIQAANDIAARYRFAAFCGAGRSCHRLDRPCEPISEPAAALIPISIGCTQSGERLRSIEERDSDAVQEYNARWPTCPKARPRDSFTAFKCTWI